MWYCFKRKNTQNNKRPTIIVNLSYKYNKVSFRFRVCEIKSVNRHSMISDGAVSSWNELAALVYITSI